MPIRAVVVGRTHLVRQQVAQSLSTLDFQVIECSELSEAGTALDAGRSALVVMDADGSAREWRALAARLASEHARTALVLLASRFGFDDAHRAMELKVAGVILKPFRKEEHTPRLLDLALRRMNLRARRSCPRFRLPETMAATLRDDRDARQWFPIRNIAESGAGVTTGSDVPGPPLVPGASFPLALLSLGDATIETFVSVIYCSDGIAGVSFSRFFDGPQKLFRILEERRIRALGVGGRKRKW